MSLIPADGRIGMFSNGEYTEKALSLQSQDKRVENLS